MLNLIHVTHEAIHKVGGIGTVLEGLINSRPYRDAVARTVLVCPLFEADIPERLGPGGRIEYSSLDHLQGSPYANDFRNIELSLNVHIVYGRRPVEDFVSKRRTVCEVLLVDLRHIRAEAVNELKGRLWELHALHSDRYEHIWDFEQYVRLAAAAAPALHAMKLATNDQPAVVFAHEFMGIATALALVAERPRAYRSVFHAHEVATVRPIVEHHPGHDVMFYNALAVAQQNRLFLPDVFGPQHDFFKHALVETTRDFDAILAVGHHVAREMRFLGREFENADITVAYNGIPAEPCTLEERRAAKALVGDYCESLLGWRPDLVFSHVTRLTTSKALWRDLDILEQLDAELLRRNQRAAFLVLSTELPRRPIADILRMESEWDWPLVHREGHPDLTPGEARFWHRLQLFNARSRNTTAVFINQFGFENPLCGRRIPAGMHLAELRRATDIEFGCSIYEPFGISPLEPLTFGGICVVSTSCGCAGFVDEVTRRSAEDVPNVIQADYIRSVPRATTIGEAVSIGAPGREDGEARVAAEVAQELAVRLNGSQAVVSGTLGTSAGGDQGGSDADRRAQAMIDRGYELARAMSWDVVAERYVFPAIQKARARRRILSVA